MGMGGGGAAGSIKSDINVTPLVDVCLVLLIIFMVVTPMLQRGKDVTLPKAHENPNAKKDPDPLILSVTKDKKMWLDKFAYDDAQMQDKLASELANAPGRKILLKGDSSLQVADVRKVMRIAQKAKAKGVALGVEEVKDK